MGDSMRYKCIIVEDEPLAVEVIENYLANFPAIEIEAVCNNALKAMDILKRTKIDLMFLDIRMPLINGIDFLKALSHPPKVIIITAYRDYALDGYDLDIVDYLLKPVSFERFVKAIDKFYLSMNKPSLLHEETEHKDSSGSYIFVKCDRKYMKVFLDDILFIESMKDYVIIHLHNRKIITKQKISHYEETLPQEVFVRIHKSYIISIKNTEAVSPVSVEVGHKELPIGRNYKNSAFARLKLYSAYS